MSTFRRRHDTAEYRAAVAKADKRAAKNETVYFVVIDSNYDDFAHWLIILDEAWYNDPTAEKNEVYYCTAEGHYN